MLQKMSYSYIKWQSAFQIKVILWLTKNLLTDIDLPYALNFFNVSYNILITSQRSIKQNSKISPNIDLKHK